MNSDETPSITSAAPAAPRKVRLPRQNLRAFASTIQRLHVPPSPPSPTSNPVTVVCISDTHCTKPPIPSGDLLLHAGDLSIWGTFSEIQEQVTWLSQQPHRHKVIIAGNHDLLLDPQFQKHYPEKWSQARHAASDNDTNKTLEDLDWHGVIYLQNSSVLVNFDGDRNLTIYGSPYTPRYGISAFQYPLSQDIWTGHIPADTDILLIHGPPRGHLDGFKKSGCAFLTREVLRVRPRLVVFGHIHVGYGTEERVYDGVGRAYEGILGGWIGWLGVLRMAGGVAWGRVVPGRFRGMERRTRFVNAAVVEGWEGYRVKNEAVVVRI